MEVQGYQLSVTGTPQDALPNTAFALPLKASLRETFLSNPLNTLPGISIHFIPTGLGADATFSAGSDVVTDSITGIAAQVATANAITGLYSIYATADGLTQAYSL